MQNDKWFIFRWIERADQTNGGDVAAADFISHKWIGHYETVNVAQDILLPGSPLPGSHGPFCGFANLTRLLTMIHYNPNCRLLIGGCYNPLIDPENFET